ncbi:retrovirus-related pol polyprotein from transposon TNT 1-94 [Tanacetum coccineum]
MCFACSLGKSKKYTHNPKSDDSIQEKLYLRHMDLCGPMRIESINGKKYILVIVDDYSRFTWNLTPNLSCEHSTTERHCQKTKPHLMDAARTMLIFSKASLFLWAEAVATACYTQNRSLIRRRHNKTPYELIHDKKPDLTYFYVFGAVCYPTNDGEDPGKLKPKVDIGIFLGYAPVKKAYLIYNRRTRVIMETIHVEFDELKAMAS